MLTEEEKKAKAAKKVAKLMAMANGKGNESEANSAMAMARQLADEHGLKQSDIDRHTAAADDYVSSGPLYSGDYLNGKALWCMADKVMSQAIGNFCCVKVGTHINGRDVEVEYFGHRIDVEIAKALQLDYQQGDEHGVGSLSRLLWPKGLKTANDLESARFSFEAAMGKRLRDRMLELRMAEEEHDEHANALVVSKQGLLKAKASEAKFAETGYGRGERRAYDPNAGKAGAAAGNRVGLQSAVAGKTAKGPVAIGR